MLRRKEVLHVFLPFYDVVLPIMELFTWWMNTVLACYVDRMKPDRSWRSQKRVYFFVKKSLPYIKNSQEEPYLYIIFGKKNCFIFRCIKLTWELTRILSKIKKKTFRTGLDWVQKSILSKNKIHTPSRFLQRLIPFKKSFVL